MHLSYIHEIDGLKLFLAASFLVESKARCTEVDMNPLTMPHSVLAPTFAQPLASPID